MQPYEDQAAVVEFNEMQQEMTHHYNAAAAAVPELRPGDYYAAFCAQDAMWLRLDLFLTMRVPRCGNIFP